MKKKEFKRQDSIKFKIDKRIESIQLGFLTAALSTDLRITEKYALRYELGSNLTNEYGNNILRFSFSFQPRYYYNFQKRAQNGKDVRFNAANFYYSKVQVYPSYVLYSSGSPSQQPTTFQLLLGYGLRRNIRKSQFHTELGLAAGLRYDYYKSSRSKFDLGADIMIRIGWSYYK